MQPIIWLAFLAALLVIEAITAGLTTIWFAGGALVASIACYFGASMLVQIFLFLGVSLLLLIFTRPMAVKYMNCNVEKTNVYSLPGQKATVIEEIDNLRGSGRVVLKGMEWMARTPDDKQKISKDTIVVVQEVQGVKLIVEENKED